MSSIENVDLGGERGGGIFHTKIPQQGSQGLTKVHFLCINKSVWRMIMADLEQPMLSYYVIYFEKSCSEQRMKVFIILRFLYK